MNRVAYISGTRADFGLLASTLQVLDADQDLDVGVIATGMHLDKHYGYTVDEIYAAGLHVIGECAVELAPRSGLTVASAAGAQLIQFAKIMQQWGPDCVMVLGDRPEMLSGAFAAALLSIPVVHVHGGERSGSIDESIRHAISKIAHVHCVATSAAAARLRKMGELAANIHLTGAPGLDGIQAQADLTRDETLRLIGKDSDIEYVLGVYHPVSQEQGLLADQVRAVIDGVLRVGVDLVLLRPNSDAGGDEIDRVLDDAKANTRLHIVKHLQRDAYLSMLKHARAMVGNSSSGIIEAASFGVPVVDIGSRQNLRERGANVLACSADADSIHAALKSAIKAGRFDGPNMYGDGSAGSRLLEIVKATLDMPPSLAKINAY